MTKYWQILGHLPRQTYIFPLYFEMRENQLLNQEKSCEAELNTEKHVFWNCLLSARFHSNFGFRPGDSRALFSFHRTLHNESSAFSAHLWTFKTDSAHSQEAKGKSDCGEWANVFRKCRKGFSFFFIKSNSVSLHSASFSLPKQWYQNKKN